MDDVECVRVRRPKLPFRKFGRKSRIRWFDALKRLSRGIREMSSRRRDSKDSGIRN